MYACRPGWVSHGPDPHARISFLLSLPDEVTIRSSHECLMQPSVIEIYLKMIGPQGDYQVGHQTWASKLAQAKEGIGPGLLFSMLSPSLVPDLVNIDHTVICTFVYCSHWECSVGQVCREMLAARRSAREALSDMAQQNARLVSAYVQKKQELRSVQETARASALQWEVCL